MSADSGGKSISADRILAAVRAYGQQKALAVDLGLTEPTLSKLLDSHLVQVCRLIDALDLEVVDKGEIEDLRRVLKRCL